MDNNPVVSEPISTTTKIEENSNNGLHTNIDMLMDVPLTVTIELGRTEMTLKQALELQQGSVVELDRLAGDPIDIFVNERLIAKGEVVVVDDKFAVRVTELISNPNKPNSQGEH
jgi:flagellar motor switch protein FliN